MIRVGSKAIVSLLLGSTAISRAYVGATQVFSAAASAWTPTSLGAALALWLDAEDTASITLNGSNVAQWNDKSGNGRNAAQATASAQPVYNSTAYNGKPVLQLNGTSHFLSAGVVSLQNTGLNVFVVGDYNDLNYFIGEYATTPASREWLLRSDSYLIQESLETFNPNNYGTGPTQIGKHILGGTFTNGQRAKFFSDGNLLGTAVQIVDSIEQGPAPLQIGRYQTFFSNANIAEVVITGAAISDPDRQKLEGYLAWKWGLVANLPVAHPYKSTPPTV